MVKAGKRRKSLCTKKPARQAQPVFPPVEMLQMDVCVGNSTRTDSVGKLIESSATLLLQIIKHFFSFFFFLNNKALSKGRGCKTKKASLSRIL